MPQRTNDFQKLVYLVRVNLASGATVTESKMLIDRVTGHEREVDICIEGQVGSHDVIVSVECRDHKRIADVWWVEQMKAKHERLPTSALILASRRGFTPEARAVATGYGIQTVALSDVDEIDFPDLLGSKSSLWTKSVTPTVERVVVKVIPTETLAGETVAVEPNNLIYSSDGNELCQIQELVYILMKSPRAREELLSKGKEDHVWFEFAWEPPRDHLGNPLFMKKAAPEVLREIGLIQIKGPCKFEIRQFGMRGGTLGDINLAWGKTEILGREALVVVTKDLEQKEKLSIKLSEKPK